VRAQFGVTRASTKKNPCDLVKNPCDLVKAVDGEAKELIKQAPRRAVPGSRVPRRGGHRRGDRRVVHVALIATTDHETNFPATAVEAASRPAWTYPIAC
jgi:hypothetical protein